MNLDPAAQNSTATSVAVTGSESVEASLGGDLYPKHVYEKLLDEKKKESEKRRLVEAELSSIKEVRLKEQNQYKELYEAKEKELNEKNQELVRHNQMVELAQKKSVAKQELLKMGCMPEYVDQLLDSADLSRVTIHKDAGNAVTGVTELSRELSEKWKPMFGKVAVGVSQAAPVGVGQKTSLDDWQKLPREELIKRKEEMARELGLR